jgi:glycosyltransferase involved in cell wall biosynthesis
LTLKIGFLPLFQIQYASSRYRVFQFLKPLAQRGFECTLIEAPQRNWWKRSTYLPRLLHLARSQDVLYVQKRVFPEAVLKLVRRINPHIIYDLDDAVYLRPALTPRVDAMLRAATIVVAGNEFLAAYARKFNEQVMKIPSVVDTDLYLPPSGVRHPGDDRVIIGWIGSDPNRGDLSPMQQVLDWLGERYGERAVLRIVSDRPLEMETRLRNEFVPWALASSRAELQQFDIGIMPLEDSEWNRSKSGFKLIQYMAVGAAAVASPVGVNQEIVIDAKTGYLATTVSEWQQRLASLIDDTQVRVQMGHAARKHVEQHYSVEAVLPLLVDAAQRAASCH